MAHPHQGVRGHRTMIRQPSVELRPRGRKPLVDLIKVIIDSHHPSASPQVNLRSSAAQDSVDWVRAGDELTIGEVAARSGVAVSAVRFYDDQGLISSVRTPAGHRHYVRSTLRRIAFIRTAQQVGLSLADIRDALASLPGGRTPNRADWARLSQGFRLRLDEQIATLERLRDGLTNCIGCGCLSLQRCRLYNPDDALAARGGGAHLLFNQYPDEDR